MKTRKITCLHRGLVPFLAQWTCPAGKWPTDTNEWAINYNYNKLELCGFQVTSLVNFMVCSASSLVGLRIRALAPVWAWGPFNLSNMGTKNAAVLPLPVLAMATISLPSKMTGIVCHNKHHEKVTRNSRQERLATIKKRLTFLWIGVGTL